ncbi:hypothetical protein HYH03_001442 [Edaphochlamys debaryana]|uniref:Uncharacterized protein n=1 Tax=Edaphochlamys debaryana TaxID=47281 RepID=A0A835YGT4_9CHLO|nr:hypothetical protein HYH03_001442 [Edaphochlamys debaryana]|eukprot:KAG2500676.1 hypothetical protein HYH03_001442 [Edaphochlamys debaryana]
MIPAARGGRRVGARLLRGSPACAAAAACTSALGSTAALSSGPGAEAPLRVLAAGAAAALAPRLGPARRGFAADAGGHKSAGEASAVQGTQEAVAGERMSAPQPDDGGGPATGDGPGAGDVRGALQAAARSGDPGEVLRVVEAHGTHFDEEALVGALASLAEAARGQRVAPEKLAAHGTFQSLLSMVVLGAERLSPAQAARVAQAMGGLRVEDQGVLDAIGRNLVSDLHRLTGPQLAELLEGYHAPGTTPGRVMADAVAQRLRGPQGRGSGGGGGSSEVPSGRATADGVPLGTGGGGSGADAESNVAAAPLEGEERERVQRALERLGYGDPGHAPPGPQGQSDRSHGTDYA